MLVCIIFWSKIKDSKLMWLMPFTILIVIVELTGRYFKEELGNKQANQILYNISIPIEYMFYTSLYRVHYQKKLFKKIANLFLIMFPVFVVINMIFIIDIKELDWKIVQVGTFSMIVLSCFYFSDIMKLESEMHLFRNPMFWIATGVLLFNAGEFLFSLSIEYMFNKFPMDIFIVFGSIIFKLICVLYTCISIAVVCIEKKPQKA